MVSALLRLGHSFCISNPSGLALVYEISRVRHSRDLYVSQASLDNLVFLLGPSWLKRGSERV